MKTMKFLIFIIVVIFISVSPLFSIIYGSVSGTVTDEETGKGIGGVKVIISSRENGFFSTFTNSEGKFTFLEVSPGKYQIAFFPPSPYAWPYAWKSDNLPENQPFVLESGKKIEIIRKLKIGGVLIVKILDLGSNVPVPNVKLYLRGAVNVWLKNKDLYSDEKGFYKRECLSAGVYWLEARRIGFGTKLIEINIEYKKTFSLDILYNFNSLTKVSGCVYCGKNKTPLKDISISIFPISNKNFFCKTFSDTNGSFEIKDIEPGEYIIQVTALKRKGHISGEDVFIKKNLKIIENETAIVNFDLDCSISYETRSEQFVW